MSFTGVSFVGDDTLSTSAASVATTVTFTGYHVLVVHGYSSTKEDTPNGKCLESRRVKVGDHHWVIKYCPNGYEKQHADYMTFYLVLDEDNIIEPVIAQYEFSLVDQFEKTEFSPFLFDASGTVRFCTRDAWSPRCYMNRKAFERSKHLNKNDSFMIRCNIATTKDINIGDSVATTQFVVVPPPDIQHHLSYLLQSQEGTDVTFQVGGQKFIAHRCVLAARSDVFKAELFGPMKEGTKNTIVCIDDMEAKVYRLLLGFMYSDSVPEIEEDEEFMWQHLLVAADKYNLRRLRLICEQKLCKYITAATVATMLEFAEQHHCQGLKGACLDFLTSPANLQEVTATGGLDHMISSCPSVLKEFITKLVLLNSDD